MLDASAARLFRRFDLAEQGICISLNRWCRASAIRNYFVVVSRLGDGWIWYALILSLPLTIASHGVSRATQFSATGAIGVAIYKFLKRRFVRERPFVSHLGIRVGTAPLDRYSFPSGHTLHAVCFAALFVFYFPLSAWFMAPLATSIAVSRVVLGLHYPTDVLVGALLGGGLAAVSIGVWPFP